MRRLRFTSKEKKMPKNTDFQIILKLNNNYVLTRTLVIINKPALNIWEIV